MAFMSLGLIVLLATPAARVLVLLLGYVRRQQWLFAAIALMVLSVLVISVVIGLVIIGGLLSAGCYSAATGLGWGMA